MPRCPDCVAVASFADRSCSETQLDRHGDPFPHLMVDCSGRNVFKGQFDGVCIHPFDVTGGAILLRAILAVIFGVADGAPM